MATASCGIDINMSDKESRFRGLEDLSQFPDLEPINKKKRLSQNQNQSIDPKTGFIFEEK